MTQEKREQLRSAILQGVEECISLGNKPFKELTPAVQDQFLKTWLEVCRNLREYFNGDDRITNLEKLIDKNKYKMLHASLEKFQKISDIANLTYEIMDKWRNRIGIQISKELWRELWAEILKLKNLLKQLDNNSKGYSMLEYFLEKTKAHQIYTIIATLESTKGKYGVKDSLLDSKQKKSGDWKIDRNGKVRAIAYAEKPNVSLKSLAEKAGLVYSEMHKWLKLDKDGNYTVPNVWIAADLMRGGSWWDRLVLNHGGTIGTFIGTDILTSGFKVLKPKTARDLETTILTYKGNIWGMVIFAHGNPLGIIAPNTNPWNPLTPSKYSTLKSIIFLLSRNGFKLAKIYPMQCYTGFKGTVVLKNVYKDNVDDIVKLIKGTATNIKIEKAFKPILGGRWFLNKWNLNFDIDWDKQWRKVGKYVKPYQGTNAFTIDFGLIEGTKYEHEDKD